MARYQIRTPENQVIDDIIEVMANKSWQILKAWNVFKEDSQIEDYHRFQKTIQREIAPYVKTYKLCGLSNICLDEVQSTSWAPPAHVLDASPTDFVYQLFPPKDAEYFLDSLTDSVWTSIQSLLKSSFHEEARSILKTSFRTILGEYMYFNPLCGKTELCVYSASSPQKVWRHS